jgi:signal transduction histidine kinase/uncharacterized protein YhfF
MSATVSSDAKPARGRDLLATVAAGTATVVGTAFLRSLVRHLAEALDADFSFVAELTAPGWERARVVASWGRGDVQLAEGVEFGIAGTACALLADEETLALPEGTARAFPGDRFVVEHGLEGYVAIVMRGADGERLGYIGVMSRRRLEASNDENAALAIFASRAAAELERRRHETALRARDTEVTASRARLVHAADEERRRIGRNLHDGAQQRLIVLGHRIDLAQRKLADAPEEAAEMLAAAREEARAASQERRELSRGLHPAGLAEYGIEPALHGLAASSPVPLKVGALPDRRLPDVLEVTLYYLVSEALANAVKYANASEVAVEVTLHAGTLAVEVSDDGVGGAVDEQGSGLRGLADRVSALGGRFEMKSPPGAGTSPRASIPLAPWRSTREPFLDYGHEGDGGLGEHLIELIRAGRKTVTVSLAREWHLEGGPPRIGQRLPVIDHHGRKRACVEVVRVTVVPFAEIGPDVVDAEAAGAGSHEEWRAAQREMYDSCRDEMAILLEEPGWRLTEEEPMVVTWFRVVE